MMEQPAESHEVHEAREALKACHQESARLAGEVFKALQERDRLRVIADQTMAARNRLSALLTTIQQTSDDPALIQSIADALQDT